MSDERTDQDALDRYDRAERVAGIGSYEYRTATGERMWSPNLYRLYGMDPETSEPLDRESFSALVNPADSEALRELLDAMSGGAPHATDVRVVRYDGDERILHLRGESTVDRLYGTVQDVTEIRATERRLRESEQQLVEAQRVAGVGSFEVRYDTEELVWSAQLYRLFGLDPAEPLWSFRELANRLRPPDLPQQGTWDPAPGHFTYERDVERADGLIRRFEIIGEVYRREGVTYSRGTVQDVTERQRTEARQAAVAALTRHALEGLRLPGLADLACKLVAEATAADGTALLELRAEGTVTVAAADGIGAPLVGTEAPDAVAAIAHQVVGEGQPVLVTDWRGEDRAQAQAMVGDTELRSAVAVPVLTAAGPFGVMGAGAAAAGWFGSESMDFMVSIANVLAVAIERRGQEEEIQVLSAQRGRLVAQTVEVEERVRRRVSEAIHDGALQNLLASRQDLVEAGEVEGPAQRELLERGRQGIETAVEELREAVQALHPVVLQHAGLEAALKAAADHAARGGGFEHDVSVEPGAAGLRDELVLSLARELLSNAAKHADASRVDVDVTVEEDQLVLTVRDDGRGMSVGRVKEAPRHGHIGLASLSERVEAIGGELDIAVASGSGACVTARMPLPGGG